MRKITCYSNRFILNHNTESHSSINLQLRLFFRFQSFWYYFLNVSCRCPWRLLVLFRMVSLLMISHLWFVPAWNTRVILSVSLFLHIVKLIIFQLNMTHCFSSSSHCRWFLLNSLLSVNRTLDYLQSPIQMQYRNSWELDWNVWMLN